MPYTYTVDQTGHDEGFAVCTPEGRQMAYLAHGYAGSEEQAEADALMIVDALNAMFPEPETLAPDTGTLASETKPLTPETNSPALELLKAVLPYARNEAGTLGLIGELEAEDAWQAVKAAEAFLESQSAFLTVQPEAK